MVKSISLSNKMRPQSLEDVIGQKHLLNPNSFFYQSLIKKTFNSMILWGPPGSGKTTLANIISNISELPFCSMSAVEHGIGEVRSIIKKHKDKDQSIVLFVDEFHRFNKAQQDIFLPLTERQEIILIGATTENPSFEVNNALLSRMSVYVLNSLSFYELIELIDKVLLSIDDISKDLIITITDDAKKELAKLSNGDARKCLNLLEECIYTAKGNQTKEIDVNFLKGLLSKKMNYFDNKGEEFYNQISALHKSIRGTSPDAALYWFARLIVSGCDPVYIIRRLVRTASEDIGNADPRALQLTLNAWDTYTRLGSPEGDLAIAQAVIYLACAPKSNSSYIAFQKAMEDAKKLGNKLVPKHLRNAPTRLMKDLGYGKNYQYPHDNRNAYIPGISYFPEGMSTKKYYEPTDRGLERKISEKLEYLQKLV